MKHHIQIRYSVSVSKMAWKPLTYDLHWNKDAVSKTVFIITVSTTVLALHDFVSYAAFEFCFVTYSPVYMCQIISP